MYSGNFQSPNDSKERGKRLPYSSFPVVMSDDAVMPILASSRLIPGGITSSRYNRKNDAMNVMMMRR